MTERERVLAILNHQQPDQLPWLADLAYYVDALKITGEYPAQYQDTCWDNGLQAMHRDYGPGFYLQGYHPFRTLSQGWEKQEEKRGGTTVTTIITPVGQLRQVKQYSPKSFSTGILEHFVKDIDDLKTYLWVAQHSSFQPDYDLARHRYETVGDNGVVLCYTPKSPLMDLLALYAGVENLTYLVMDEEEEFSAILEELGTLYDTPCRIALESPAECLMIPENISSECAAPFYQRYMKAYHQKWTAAIREMGKFSFVHQDGTVRGLISQLSKESHFDVIEAVTPLPAGDVDIAEVASLVDDSTIIWGGIPGGMFREDSCSDKEFDEHVLRCIQVMTSAPPLRAGRGGPGSPRLLCAAHQAGAGTGGPIWKIPLRSSHSFTKRQAAGHPTACLCFRQFPYKITRRENSPASWVNWHRAPYFWQKAAMECTPRPWSSCPVTGSPSPSRGTSSSQGFTTWNMSLG